MSKKIAIVIASVLAATYANAAFMIGTNPAAMIYVGTNKAANVYLGTNLVWTANAATNITSGLVINWDMTEGSGYATTDHGTAGNTLAIGSSVVWTNRKSGANALYFPNTAGSYCRSTNAVAEGYTTGYTFACWINPTSMSVSQYFKDTQNAERSLIIGYPSGYFNVYFYGYLTGSQADTKISGTTSWQHLCFTSDGTNFIGYVNGLQGSKVAWTGAGFNVTKTNVLGGYSLSGVVTPYYQGGLGNIQIYGRALSSNEVLQVYNATK